jgi:fluoroacetyl-CoA thioesterase
MELGMKAGLHNGQSTEIEIVVTRDMLAEFDGQAVNDLYATSALVHNIEQVCHGLLTPFLESHEQVVTSYIEISHLMLTVTGMKVRLKATATEIRENKIVCEIEAHNVRGKIAKGSVTQVIVENHWLDRKVKEMSIINNLSSESSLSKN